MHSALRKLRSREIKGAIVLTFALSYPLHAAPGIKSGFLPGARSLGTPEIAANDSPSTPSRFGAPGIRSGAPVNKGTPPGKPGNFGDYGYLDDEDEEDSGFGFKPKAAPKLPPPPVAAPKAPAKPNLFNNDDDEEEDSGFNMKAKAPAKLPMPALPKPPAAKPNLFNNNEDDEEDDFKPKKKADFKPLAMPMPGAKPTLPPPPVVQ